MIKKYIIAFLLAGVVVWMYSHHNKTSHHDWQDLGNGIEWKKMYIEDTGMVHHDAEVIVLCFDPQHLHVVAGSPKTAREWREQTQGVAAVNGGFFDEKNHSLGLRRAEGKSLSALRQANWGVFFIQKGKAHILHTRDFRNIDQTGISEAIQCGPRLVVDGKPTDLKEQWARRSGIGIDGQGKVLLAVCDEELPLRQWAEFWAKGLHCEQALNLDGGGSTQLSLKSAETTVEIDGNWPVPDAVVVR